MCVHFDGAKELRGKNMMRVCIRIMNPILRGGPNRKVQSETDVWPISSFYIKKEDYATLHPVRGVPARMAHSGTFPTRQLSTDKSFA